MESHSGIPAPLFRTAIFGDSADFNSIEDLVSSMIRNTLVIPHPGPSMLIHVMKNTRKELN
jgi:hypothetical protein